MIQTNKYNAISFNFLISPQYRLARYIVLILGILFIAAQNLGNNPEQIGKELLRSGFMAIILIGILFLNIYILAPSLLLKNKLLAYVLSVIGAVLTTVLLIIITQLLIVIPHPEASEPSAGHIVLNIFSISIQFGLFITGTSTILLFRQWITTEQRIEALKNANMQMELEQLKKQINPHFLFNMLNNANVLTKKNPDEAANVLVKLKDLLQYEINDSGKEYVELKSEIQFLSDFLNLEKVRRDKFEFTVSTKGNMNHVVIPPLLFIPFVENAVKHNNDSMALSFVHLSFNVDKEWLQFICINSKPVEPYRKKESGGLGLVNIKRRLKLLFRKDYNLDITENEITYTVNLQIKL